MVYLQYLKQVLSIGVQLCSLLSLLVAAGVSDPAHAHPSHEMDAVRLAVDTWAVGLLNQDFEAMTSVVAPDLETGETDDRGDCVASLQRQLPVTPVTSVITSYAYFEQDEDGFALRALPGDGS